MGFFWDVETITNVIIIIIIISWCSFTGFEWQQNSRTHFTILAVLTISVVWMVSIRPPISKSSRHFNNPLVTVPKAAITIGRIDTFMFHRFFSVLWQGRDTYPSFPFLSTWFCGQLGQQSRQFCKVFLLLIIIRFGLLVEIWWFVCISKSHRSLYV